MQCCQHSYCISGAVWGMRVGIDSLLSLKQMVLDSGVFNGPKRIQTPHSLFRDFGAFKTFTTRWSGGRVQVWAQVRAPASHLAITEGHSRRNRRFWLQNQWPGSWGRAQKVQARKQGVSMSAAVDAGRDRLAWEKNCYYPWDTGSVQESKSFNGLWISGSDKALTKDLFFHLKWNFPWSSRELGIRLLLVVYNQSSVLIGTMLSSFFKAFDHSLVSE